MTYLGGIIVKKTLVAFAAVSFISTQLSFAADCKQIETVSPGQLTVAAYDYPPFTFASPDGAISGIDPAIVKRFATDSCLELVTLVMDPAATIQSVVAGKADLAIGSWNRTENRRKVLDLSAPLYIDHMGIYSKAGYDEIEATVDKRAGTVTGFFWVADLQKLFGTNLKLYPTPVALAQDLAADRLDVGFLGYNAGSYNQKNNGAYPGIAIKMAKPDERIQATVLPPQTAILYTKGNQSLGKALDESIAAQHADGSLAKTISDVGFDPEITNVGEPRFVK
ncbi:MULTISPECIES: transporter substrate-binding domain-containing protein [unclassified Rhizobium]|uniref:substrate-binding periplasmic protein n=1 Tax=unclassified Rhizobium TaxID=2613769 RepID=UPI00190FFF29|nr:MULTISPECIES: transporter substrate-binding domain-containing protein [unclassified Rhizobium]